MLLSFAVAPGSVNVAPWVMLMDAAPVSAITGGGAPATTTKVASVDERRPVLSVNVTPAVNWPASVGVAVGLATVVADVNAVTIPPASTTRHAKDARVWPDGNSVVAASSVIGRFAVKVAGDALICACSPDTARIAAPASSMPAPQVVVVQ